MNIDDMTYGQIRQILNLFEQHPAAKKQCLAKSIEGKYVIVRSRNEGINAGYVEAADETGIVLTEARRIWYHRPESKSMSWYEGVAISGLSSDSKVSETVARKVIIEDYSITECSDFGAKSIQDHESHAQG